MPSRQGGGRSSLSRALDNDVLQIVRKLLDEQPSGARYPSSRTVYEWIQRSNSSLKRKPKNLIENSIEWALEVLREDTSDEDQVLPSESTDERQARADAANLMNKSIVGSWASPGTATPVTNGKAPTMQVAQRQANGEPAKKRRKPAATEEVDKPAMPNVRLVDIGGVAPIKNMLKKYVIRPLLFPEEFSARKIPIPRGVLIHGPPGCGKTLISRAVATELGVPCIEILGPSIVSGMSGESEKQVRELFAEARRKAPCLIFIDEIDVIAPKRDTSQSQMEKRIVAQFLVSMDSLAMEDNDGRPVIVLAATNRPDSLDPALRRGGRFDKEINMGVPNESMRKQILHALTRGNKLAPDVDFDALAKMTPGFVGADLRDLVGQAGSWSMDQYWTALEAQAASLDTDMDLDNDTILSPEAQMNHSIQRLIARSKDKSLARPPGFEDTAIPMRAFVSVLPNVQPSSKREGFATIPDTTWSDIGALQSVREELHAAIVDPIKRPERYARVGISAPAGILLWGPPGCGKTLLAKAVANESKANFISVKGPELLNKYVGESERAVRTVFSRARSSIPCVVFFDELDALVPKRDDVLSEASARVVNTLLTELDGIGQRDGIYIIAATNRPDIIDPAMLRPGRLDTPLFVGLPGADERVEILTALIRKTPIEVGLARMAKECEHFSGADLSNLLRKAGQNALKRDSEVVAEEDFALAVKTVRPSVGPNDLLRYERIKERLSLGSS
ncbi:AAA-domain-containing protein [Rhizodiscina lignyota]|uniref:Peroxisomal ATPase PEX1 n=1 Tax=Rhizodiscina lignyota TaxID=1504668 RepID=A0A9P4M9I7_9PEZI|nr:AAA-domain-containing protein [Rhizodiscina lignyota]